MVVPDANDDLQVSAAVMTRIAGVTLKPCSMGRSPRADIYLKFALPQEVLSSVFLVCLRQLLADPAGIQKGRGSSRKVLKALDELRPQIDALKKAGGGLLVCQSRRHAAQVLYEGFDPGGVLPDAQVLPVPDTNPTAIEISMVALGGQPTADSGLVGSIRFRTTGACVFGHNASAGAS